MTLAATLSPTDTFATMRLTGLAPDVQVIRLLAYPHGTYVNAVLISPDGLPSKTWDGLIEEVKRVWRGLAACSSREGEAKKQRALLDGYDAHTRDRILEAWETAGYDALVLRIAGAQGLDILVLPSSAWGLAKLWG